MLEANIQHCPRGAAKRALAVNNDACVKMTLTLLQLHNHEPCVNKPFSVASLLLGYGGS
jgi:hypothetical protein